MPQLTQVSKNATDEEQTLIETIRTEIEQGKLVTYWKIGKHIKKHLLKNKKRADYGKTLFPLLSEHLSIDVTTLYRSVTFFEEYPKILDSSQELTWTHMRILLSITDESARQALIKQVIEKHLTVVELKELIHHSEAHSDKVSDLILEVERTAPYVFEAKIVQGRDMIDLGFNFFIDTPTKTKGESRVELGSVPHYTYRATLLEVLDGDTIWVDIDLGYNTWTTQKLRFRGVNSAEIVTPEGKTAKDHAAACLSECKFIAVKTYWRDKFTRYLADIFYDKNEADLAKLIQNGKFLNQELLDEGYAVEYESL